MDQSEILVIKDACQSISLQFGRLQDERCHDDLAGLMTADASYIRLGEELTLDAFIAWVKGTWENLVSLLAYHEGVSFARNQTY